MTDSNGLKGGSLPPLVVDASVGVKWVIQEEHTLLAIALFKEGRRMIVPDRFLSEIANVLWKRTRRTVLSEQITEEDARQGLTDILSVNLEVVSSAELVRDSLEIALELGHSTYDCDYLALAFTRGADFVTADEKLYRKFSAHPKYGPLLRWVDPLNPPR